jgi:hypothetical protein
MDYLATPENEIPQAMRLRLSFVWRIALYQPPHNSRTHKRGEKSPSIGGVRYRPAHSLIGTLVERISEVDFPVSEAELQGGWQPGIFAILSAA